MKLSILGFNWSIKKLNDLDKNLEPKGATKMRGGKGI